MNDKLQHVGTLSRPSQPFEQYLMQKLVHLLNALTLQN